MDFLYDLYKWVYIQEDDLSIANRIIIVFIYCINFDACIVFTIVIRIVNVMNKI